MKPTVILLSFDGFRHDYIKRENLQNFAKLATNGVYSNRGLQSAFVTKTFPNHFTIVTGLYEESHGIVANNMYDPVYEEKFFPGKGSLDQKWWNATIPIWIENEIGKRTKVEKRPVLERSKPRKSATIFWPGSFVPYRNHRQYYNKHPYDDHYPSKKRFDAVVDLLLEEDPVNFIACYFTEPDSTSHDTGTNSPKLTATLKNLDGLLGQFMDKLKQHNLFDQVSESLPYVPVKLF